MKYRIISDGKKYIIQYRYKYWPFWFSGRNWLELVVEYNSFSDAQREIVILKNEDNIKKRKWKVVG